MPHTIIGVSVHGVCVFFMPSLAAGAGAFVSDGPLTNTNWFEEYDRRGVSIRFIRYECVVLILMICVNVV